MVDHGSEHGSDGGALPAEDALAAVLPGSRLTAFVADDVDELVVLQRACWLQEAIANDTLDIPVLHESRDDVLAEAERWRTFVVRIGPRLVASFRVRGEGDAWDVGRLMVVPDLAGRGVGSAMLGLAETLAPAGARRAVMFTGARSERNLRTYARAGYVAAAPGAEERAAGIVRLAKDLERPAPEAS